MKNTSNTSSDNSNNSLVLVGIGTVTLREEDFTQALEPMDLMLEAVAAAGADSQSTTVPQGLQYVAVLRGRWSYSNPAGEIACRYGAAGATTVLTTPGVQQQTLLGEVCACIARGEVHTALVTAADAGYRLRRSQIAGQQASERVQGDEPDIYLKLKDELRHPVEKRAGLQMPVGLYAILGSALRPRNGWCVADHRDRRAALWARFNDIARDNPDAWERTAVSAATIREASKQNPMQAFPYTRFHCLT